MSLYKIYLKFFKEFSSDMLNCLLCRNLYTLINK